MAAAERAALSTWPAAASTAMAALINGPVRPAEIIADFPVARYLAADAAVIALVTPAAVRLPNALVCHELPPSASSDHARPRLVISGTSHSHDVRSAGDHGNGGWALVGDGRVQFGRARVAVTRWWDPVPRLPPVDDPPELGRAVDEMRSLVPDWPGADDPAAGQLAVGRDALAEALAGGVMPSIAVDQLVGLGPGLTPAGDDLIAGAVAGLVLFGRATGGREALDRAERLAAAVDERAARTTVLAADLGRHAAMGAVAEPVAAMCRAMAGKEPLERALDRLLAIGHTSGRDLAEGLLLGTAAALSAR